MIITKIVHQHGHLVITPRTTLMQVYRAKAVLGAIQGVEVVNLGGPINKETAQKKAKEVYNTLIA